MKTTIELPEELLLQAKRTALCRGTTLKALVEAGIRQILTQPALEPSNMPYRFPVITAMSRAEAGTATDVNAIIDHQGDQLLDRL